ncbi:fibrillin-3-like [Schistocerca piceifrons]|uniref:fibrillin-3-like n=1 Tax=Schistocerca piceifrons TaxID=274613 RepID=UPI001F5F6E36|nr:fibrillin-3-like [Schistocerca piceifrons]
MGHPAPYAKARALRRILMLLMLLLLMLTLATQSAVSAGVGRQRVKDGTAPKTWLRLKREEAEHDVDGTDNHHRNPSTDKETPAGIREGNEGGEGTSDKLHVDNSKSRTAGEDQPPHDRQGTESAGGSSAWLKHYMRSAHNLRRRDTSDDDTTGPKGECACLKELLTNCSLHQKTRIPIQYVDNQGESSRLLYEGNIDLNEISKPFCSPGSIVILTASLKTHGTGFAGILQVKIQCVPTMTSTDFIHSHESSDGKKSFSWSTSRNFMSFTDVIRMYVSNGRRRNGPQCCPPNKNDASCLDFDESRDKVSKSNTTKNLPKVVKGIKCRYDLLEGAVNDIGQKTAACKKNCSTVAGRTVCSCADGSKAGEDEDDATGVVRHCMPLDPGAGMECPQGYDLDTDAMVCVDIDECQVNNGGCDHECENTNGGSRCKCRPGFFLMEDQKRCDDRDECAIGENGRPQAPCAYRCTNLPNGFMCTCPEGFEVSQPDIMNCINRKENITITQEGTFYSKPTIPAKDGKCPKGFTLDANNMTCTDIDECRRNISGCAHICNNIYGGFNCQCRNGFSIMRDGKSCEDDNECRYRYISRCEHKCQNTEGSYRCTCRPGYSLGEDQKSCEDIDECRDNTSGCSQLCDNTEGSYKCSCSHGFYIVNDMKTCEDFNECRLNRSGCDHECENTQGSFRCMCRPGYYLAEDQKTCRDIDECRRNTSGCAHQCENTVGGYRCLCRPGYFLMKDGKSCDDRDECAADPHGHTHAPCSHQCINLPGSYTCACPEGFVLHAHVPGLCVEDEEHSVTAREEGADLS